MVVFISGVQFTITILSFRTDTSGQTVQTHQEEQSDQDSLFANPSASFGRIALNVKPPCSIFRVTTANFSGVQICRTYSMKNLS